jgi:TonB family protein
MHVRVLIFLFLASFSAVGQAGAASREVQYGPPPEWVGAPPSATGTKPPDGSPLQIFYGDTQVRLGPHEDALYTAYRLKVLTAEGLSAGNFDIVWNPSADTVTVHTLKIIRDEREIDVLAGETFQIIQRENNLEYAMLDGELTATLQASGLQVGDEIEFAMTVRTRDPVLGNWSNGALQAPVAGAPGVYRARLIWPAGETLNWRATPDQGKAVPVVRDGHHVLTLELRDPVSAIFTNGAPGRYNFRRQIEYTDFTDWSQIAGIFWPLYDQAATLAPDSPLRQEAARIAAATPDPVARAEAALALVQEQVRYVYVGMHGGNYRPASAEDTWQRRFGDCKAKSALLLALLRALDIPAEVVLVNAAGADGIDERLPSVRMFDHAVVRVTLGGRAYWLDGTRLGDRVLARLPPPAFRWALPVRADKAALEAVPDDIRPEPTLVEVIEIDATAGIDVPAKVSAMRVLRGDGQFQVRTQLSRQSAEDADRTHKAYWRDSYPWIEPEKTAWRYDEARDLLVFTMSGEGTPDWEGNEREGHSLTIENAGFPKPERLHRPAEQDQGAPWRVAGFPDYSCWVTTIKLPVEVGRWRWEHDSRPVNLTMGGVSYWREASLGGGVMRTVMSKRAGQREISAAEAAALNQRLSSFNDDVSSVFQVASVNQATASVPAAPAIDWTDPAAPCGPSGAPAAAAASTDPSFTPPVQDPAHPVTQPAYPLLSVMAREEGAVILRFTVREDGTVDPATIVVEDGSGSAVLDGAAVAEAANWRFKPARAGGRPVASPHHFRVVFELKYLQGMPSYAPPPSSDEAAPAPSANQSWPITQPPYPRSAVEAGAEGDVILQFVVQEDGFVDPESIVVKKSSGFADLDKAAVDEAALNWRFRPATLNGKPVSAPHRFRVVFELKHAQPLD